MALLRSLASSSHLLKSLLHSTRPFSIVSPLTSRSISTFPSYSDSDYVFSSDSSSDDDDYDDDEITHPFVASGPKYPLEVKDEEEAVYARVDMPGISKEGLKLWVENDSLCVKGEEDKKGTLFFKEEARKYSFNIGLPKGEYKAEQINAVVMHGVLRVFVPKLKFEEREGVYSVKVE